MVYSFKNYCILVWTQIGVIHYFCFFCRPAASSNKPLELVPGAYEDSYSFLKSNNETVDRFKRVSDLVEGFESPFGLELLSTVHWVINREGAQSQKEVVLKTHNWNNRKKQFTQRQISIAIRILCKHGWISNCSNFNETDLQCA